MGSKSTSSTEMKDILGLNIQNWNGVREVKGKGGRADEVKCWPGNTWFPPMKMLPKRSMALNRAGVNTVSVGRRERNDFKRSIWLHPTSSLPKPLSNTTSEELPVPDVDKTSAASLTAVDTAVNISEVDDGDRLY